MLFSSILIFLTLSFAGQVPIDSVSDKLTSNAQHAVHLENEITYDKGILRNKLDYKLIHGKKGRFILKFPTDPNQSLEIKIYDVVGNLIRTDKFLKGDTNEKEYDFSYRNTKIYVVKVSSPVEDIVKKINI